MAGTIVLDAITDGTGNTVSGSTVVKGSAKAWVRFVGSTGSIYGSFNVSSITRNGTGDYSINFTTAMPNGNYATVGNAGDTGGSASATPTYIRPCNPTTTFTRIGVGYASGGTQALYDYDSISVSVFSS
jgi:hypothetical protein